MVESAPVVCVVEDDPSVREALQSLIRSAGFGVEVFASARAFLERGRPEGPGCLVLDIGLPDLGGLELQARMTELQNDLPIIFITGHGDIPMSVRAMKAGALEFLTKPFREEELLGAIETAITRDRTARRQEHNLAELREWYATLTPRQRQVMELVTAGRLNKQIAGELGTSEVTVKVHRGRVMTKMHADSLPDLVTKAAALRRQGSATAQLR